MDKQFLSQQSKRLNLYLRGTGINGAFKMASDLMAPWRDGVRIKSAREKRAKDFESRSCN